MAARDRLGAVAMFHVGRCGSTVLSDLLAQHPEVGWDGESYVRVLTDMKRDVVTPETSGFDPAGYIGDRLDRVGARWFLYNLKFDHVARFGWDMTAYIDAIESRGVDRLIVLRRRNLLRKLVSGKMAEARAGYHSRDPRAAKPIVVSIDVDEVEMDGRSDSLIGHIERWDRLYEDFDDQVGDRQVLRVEYETDVVAEPRVAYEKVIGHLGLTPHEVEVRLQRLNPFAIEEVVANAAAVEATLRGTRHEWMLD